MVIYRARVRAASAAMASTEVSANPARANSRRAAAISAARVWSICSLRKDRCDLLLTTLMRHGWHWRALEPVAGIVPTCQS